MLYLVVKHPTQIIDGIKPAIIPQTCFFNTFFKKNLIKYGTAPIAHPNVFISTSLTWATPVPAIYCQDSIPNDKMKATRIDHGPIKTVSVSPNG